MKIAIPVDDNSTETSVGQSLGRARYFLIYDTDSHEGVFLENNASGSPGGAGVKAAQQIVDTNVKALLTPRCGENAAKVIEAAEIKIYKTIDASIKNTIQAFKKGNLSRLEDFHAGFHHGGH